MFKNNKNKKYILFVDDELDILDSGEQILKRLGYEVTVASDALKAFEYFSKDPDKFHLIITDQNMPFMKGSELIDEIRNIRPHIPAIICTGLSDDIEKAPYMEILLKPVSIMETADKIEKSLSEEDKELCHAFL